MKQSSLFRFLLNSLVVAVLAGQFAYTLVSSCQDIVDCRLEIVEHGDSEGSQSEEEIKKEESKIYSLYLLSNIDLLRSGAQFELVVDSSSIHHPEVSTPPPKRYRA